MPYERKKPGSDSSARGRSNSAGPYGSRSRTDGSYGGRADSVRLYGTGSEGSYGSRSDSAGHYGTHSDGHYGGRSDSASSYGSHSHSDGHYGSRSDSASSYGSHSHTDGHYGSRSDSASSYGSHSHTDGSHYSHSDSAGHSRSDGSHDSRTDGTRRSRSVPVELPGLHNNRVRSGYRSRKRLRRKRIWLNRLLTLVFLGIFLYSGIRLTVAIVGYRDTAKTNAELQAAHDAAQAAVANGETPVDSDSVEALADQVEVTLSPTPVPTATPEPTATPAPYGAKTATVEEYQYIGEYMLLDLAEMREKNADLVAWLEIADVVDLPVMYRDNVYYLTHDFYNREKSSGALFLDVNHPFTARTQHLVIHGHNMYDGGMFGKLSQYEKVSFGKTHGVAYLETLYEKDTYLLLAVSITPTSPGDEGYIPFIGTPIFEDEDALDEYMDKLEDGALYITPIDVDINDAILTLSTCLGDDRLLVTFRRMRSDETVESITELLNS